TNRVRVAVLGFLRLFPNEGSQRVVGNVVHRCTLLTTDLFDTRGRGKHGVRELLLGFPRREILSSERVGGGRGVTRLVAGIAGSEREGQRCAKQGAKERAVRRRRHWVGGL